MKNYKPIARLGQVLAAGLLMLQSSAVFATANDLISNSATLSYTLGGAQTTAPAVASFREDRLLNVTVTGGGNTSVVTAATGQAVPFTVQNNSNAVIDILLKGVNYAAGDNFNVSNIKVYVDNGADTTTYSVADDTAEHIDNIAEGATVTVWIVSDMPGALVNGNTSIVSLVTQVAETDGTPIIADDSGGFSPGSVGADPFQNGIGTTVAVAAGVAAPAAYAALTVQDVFGDLVAGTQDGTATNALDNADGVKDGQDSDDGTYTVGAPILSITKTATAVRDPVNANVSPKAIPLAHVEYVVNADNDVTATASGSLTDIDDTIPVAEVTLVALIVPATGAAENGANNVRVDINGSTRAVTQYYCIADAADGNADGCTYTVGTGALNVDLTQLMPADAVNGYGAGELKPNENVDITYHVTVN